MTDRVGQQLGNYRLIRLLGQGGAGDVYLGEHVYLKTQAAIKVLQVQLASDDSKNFLEEARIIAGLVHPNIVRVLDFGMEGNIPFLVMDYASNGNLRQRHPRGSRVPLTDIVLYTKQVAAALQYAHDKKLIHRDVKPENMLLGANSDVLLSDFGIAVVAPTVDESMSILNMAGTIAYMAPEQIEAKPRPASDQYALGVVVYEWLCGEHPFEGSLVEIASKHLTTPPPLLHQKVPEISHTVELVVMTALNKDPQHRFASVQAFANALEQAYRIDQPSQVNMYTFPSAISRTSEQSAPPISSFPTAMQGETLPVDDLPTHAQTIPESQNPNAQTIPAEYSTPLEEHLPAAVPGKNKCPHCGAEILPGNRFCPNCGKSLFVSVLSLESEVSVSSIEDFVSTIASKNKNKCPYCGSEIRVGDIFCFNCGNRLIHEAPAVEEEYPGTIGTRFMQTFEGQFRTVETGLESESSLSIVPSKEQTPVDEPKIIVQDSTEPSNSPSPSHSTIALDQTIAQLLEEGEIHYQAKRYEKALAIYTQIIQLDSRNTQAHGSRGNVLGRLGRYKHALAAYEAALDIDSKHGSIWNAKGDILFKLRRYEKALDAYNVALELNSENVRTWTAKGNTLFKLRRFEEALDAYNHAIALNANYAVIWSKGKVLFELERYEEALDAYERALRISPKKAAMWDEKGDVLYKMKRYEEALDDHSRALALDPYNVAIDRKCDRLRDLLKHLQKKAIQAQAAYSPDDKVFGHEDQVAGSPGRDQSSHEFQNRLGRSKQAKEEAESTTLVEYFDVFLSYSEADTEWVENLAKHLEDEHKFRVWLDKWVLIPGQSWQQAKARGLDQAKCCVVCIGEHTPEGWTEQEIQRAKIRQAKDPSFGVIPVLLPTAKDINVDNFLELNAPVDFRNVDSAYALHLLVCGVKGEPPGRWSPKETMSTRTIILAQDMLEDLQRLRQTNLITDPIKEEYTRITMEKVWLAGWTLKVKDSTDE